MTLGFLIRLAGIVGNIQLWQKLLNLSGTTRMEMDKCGIYG